MALRIVLALVATLNLAMWQTGGCGYTPDPLKGEGEPCTRSDECQSTLTCRGGVCMAIGLDASTLPDAGRPDSGPSDSGMDSGADAGDAGDAAMGDEDASMDGALPDAGPVDGGDAGDAAMDAG